jgi:hypothetical protein
MKKILFISLIFLFFPSYSQTKSEKLKAISIIESLSYEEKMFMGAKVIDTYKINYDDNTRRVEIIMKSQFSNEWASIHKFIFFIDDLELNTIEENLTDSEKSGLFSPTIRVKAKGKLIRHDVINEDKYNVLGNSSKTEYSEYIAIYPGLKVLPRLHAERFNANVKILLFN